MTAYFTGHDMKTGCTGLLIAQGLRKVGIEATVFERSTRDRPFRNWSMLLHWGREAVEEVLPADVTEQLFKEAGTDPSLLDFQPSEHAKPMPVYNGKTGELLVDLGWPAIRRYSRAQAVDVLRCGIDVRYGKELIDIVLDDDNNSARLKFKDGSTASGDVVVGTDSANSFVRSWLFHHEPRARVSNLPIIAYNIHAKYPRDLAITLREHPHILNKLVIHPEHTTWYMLAPL
nr:fad-dependent monooxygenase cctm [Quercus suber]